MSYGWTTRVCASSIKVWDQIRCLMSTLLSTTHGSFGIPRPVTGWWFATRMSSFHLHQGGQRTVLHNRWLVKWCLLPCQCTLLRRTAFKKFVDTSCRRKQYTRSAYLGHCSKSFSSSYNHSNTLQTLATTTWTEFVALNVLYSKTGQIQTCPNVNCKKIYFNVYKTALVHSILYTTIFAVQYCTNVMCGCRLEKCVLWASGTIRA